jgi:hypothetical protein
MGNRFAFRLLIALLAIAAIAAVGVYSYNLGVAHGLVQSGHEFAAPGAGPPFAYWPHPWAFGFGFFPFLPLLFIFFLMLLLRGLFWRGPWGRGGGYCQGGVPPAFEEWHRRVHAQPGSPGPSGTK